MKKKVIVATIFLLVFQNLLLGMTGIANQEDEVEPSEELIEKSEEISVTNDVYMQGIAPVQLTNVTMYYLDGSQTEVDVESEEAKKRLSRGEDVKLDYTWHLPNSTEYGEGDIFEFFLPTEFRLHNDIEDRPLEVNGIHVGNFGVTQSDNKVVMIFNDSVQNVSNIAGSLSVWSVIKEDLQSDTSQVEIYFPIEGGGKIIPIKLKPSGGSIITKRGSPNHQYNGTELSWTVDINTALETINNAGLIDSIQNDQKLVVSSIEVFQLDVDLNGNVTRETLATPSQFTDHSDEIENKLEINFGNIDSAYRVKFKTIITAEWDGGRDFRNTATLTGDGVNQSASNNIFVRRGEMLNKRTIPNSYDPKTQSITWEIQYNYSQKAISANDAVLDDIFNSSHGLAMEVIGGLNPDSFEVYEVTLDANGSESRSVPVLSTRYTVSPLANGFRISFNDDINSAYKIIYSTKASNIVYHDDTITNTVSIDGASSKLAYQSIQQQLIRKNHQNVNYATKTVDWTIQINGNEFEMENVVIQDRLPNAGLELIENSVVISGLNPGDYTVEPVQSSYKNGFTITFHENITQKHTITYTTRFDHSSKSNSGINFQNEATLEWDLNGTKQTSKTVMDTFNPDQFTNNNGFKKGSYNAESKVITWEIGINYNLDNILGATVEDTLLQGQKLVPGSLKIHKMILTGGPNGSAKGEEVLENEGVYTLELTENNNEITAFKITFSNPAPADSPYLITFETTLDQLLIDDVYRNTAVFTNGSITKHLQNSVSINHGKEYTYKEADYTSGVLVDWKIWINRGQSQVPAGAKIIDTPSDNQILLEDTFKLYGTKVHHNGDVSKDSNLLLSEGVDYTLNILTNGEDKEIFEIIFTDAITSPYVLEYQSFINARNGESVNNSVVFSGQGIATETTETNRSITVRLSGGSGSGSGEVGSLTVTKVDADDESEMLEGATFSLYFASNNKLIKTLKTGTDGKVTFENLLFTNYILVEDEAPNRYVIGINDTHPITLTSGNTDEQITVKNKSIESILGEIGDYVWFDANRNGIQDEEEIGVNDVIVNLYKEKENEPGEFEYIANTKTDDKNGEPGFYLFDKLWPGKYKVEFILPNGYEYTKFQQGSDFAKDSDANPEDGFSEVIQLGEGESNLTIDAGLVLPLGKIGDYVWFDSNRNGIQDPYEVGLNDVKVELYKEDEQNEFIIVDEKETANKEDKPGYYLFDELEPGNYKVKFYLPAGYEFTQQETGSALELDSNADVEGWTDVIVLGQGETNLTIDAGLVRRPGSDHDEDDDNDGGSYNPSPPSKQPDEKNKPKEKKPGQSPPAEDVTETDPTGSEAKEDLNVSEEVQNDRAGNMDSSLSPSSENNEGETKRILPQTGETLSILPLVGVLLCIAAILLWFNRKRIMPKENI